VDSALAAAGKLVVAGNIDDALQLLRVLPRDVLRSGRVHVTIAALEDEQNRTLYRMAGRAYGLLGSDLGSGHRIMQRVAAASADSSAAAAVAVAFRTREQASADRAVAEAVQKSEALVRSRDLPAAEALVNQTSLIAALASPRQKTEWLNHTNRLSKKGLRGRVAP
jgi:hypothetical protein